MTDTDIVKALKCCGKNVLYENCGDCPYEKDFGKDHICTIKVAKDTLDLINRQQAEIKWKTNMLHDLQVSMEEIKPQIKAEAIKEYMKILEEKLSQNTDISNVGYQSIVFDMEQGYKEMVGEGK